MSLRIKISLLGIGSVLLTALALLGAAVWQSGHYHRLAQREVDALIENDLDHITSSVHTLVQTENEAVQQQLNTHLKLARHLLTSAGGISISADETVGWTARDQLANSAAAIELPKMMIGGRWLGQNADPRVESPIVDEVTKLVGETATLFQRMNPRGDMLRVATTVETGQGRRAIGTFISAVAPDQTPNPVIAAVLRGEAYRGRAYVLDAWHLTAYEPLRGPGGEVVGMLYVGVKQRAVEDRVRHAILKTRVGKTGYVYVLGASGAGRGRYVVSYRGERDGEDVWNSKDSDRRFVIREIIRKATRLRPGELATERYRWQNVGERSPRWKIARLAYYAPWDWVIGTSVYEDELKAYRQVLSGGRVRMMGIMTVAGLLITLFVGLVGVAIIWTFARPVQQMTRAVETMSQGDLQQVVEVRTRDEIGRLAAGFNLMTGRLRETMEGLESKNQELERFTYTVSHDLRSPLVTIRGFLGHVEQGVKVGDTEQVLSDLGRIGRAAARMELLLGQLLELSRIGRLLSPPEEVALGALASEAVSLVAGPVAARGVQVTIASDLPTVRGDRQRLGEVLQNLVENAVKYMGEQSQPRIEIGRRCDGEEEVIVVRDNGVGIEPRHQQRIFSLFEKLDPKTEGTGVGLAIVKRIVELHGGRIWVESEGAGRGSAFCFTLGGASKGGVK